MKTTVVIFRGGSYQVEYKDFGYEPDTNAHVIEWSFVDKELQDFEMTDEEEQQIYMQILNNGDKDNDEH